jgi:hypothetical protein
MLRRSRPSFLVFWIFAAACLGGHCFIVAEEGTCSSSIAAEERTQKIAGVDVTISKPYCTPTGVTFLLPGTLIDINEYNSTKNVLLEQNQLVLRFFLNPFVRLNVTKTHHEMAESVRDIFSNFTAKGNFPEKYNIVGHSLGGKIAFLVAALYDVDRVSHVLAFDPAEFPAAEFSNGKVSLSSAKATINMTRAEKGGTCSPDGYNAVSICKANKGFSYTLDKDAGHMAYTDNGGGKAGLICFPFFGTKIGNANALENAHNLIRQLIV